MTRGCDEVKLIGHPYWYDLIYVCDIAFNLSIWPRSMAFLVFLCLLLFCLSFVCVCLFLDFFWPIPFFLMFSLLFKELTLVVFVILFRVVYLPYGHFTNMSCTFEEEKKPENYWSCKRSPDILA